MENYCNYIVNNKNLIYNIENYRKVIGENVKFCAVVKADAYGVGYRNICKTLYNYVDFFAVALVSEAKKLREYDKNSKILVLGMVSPKDFQWCAENNVSIILASNFQLKELLSISLNKPINIHIKINTGMNRLGFNTISQVKKVESEVVKNPNINIEGMLTHFATKFSDEDFIKQQKFKFDKFIKNMDKPIIFHCSNSYVSSNLPQFNLDMVRVGFGMYGMIENSKIKTKPVVKITSQIVFIRNIKRGESVGYDRTFIAGRSTRVAVVSIGYADGLDRRLSNKFSLLVNGKFCRIIGNICMDVCMIDVTDVKNVGVGTEVVIVGGSGINSLNLSDYAKVLGTSVYDVLLKFDYKRMNTIYIN